MTTLSESVAGPAETNATPRVVAVLAALSALGTLATNILLPSLPSIGRSLDVSTAATSQLITAFLLMFALGQLLVGPLSDRYGRRIPVLCGFAIFILGSVVCMTASSMTMLVIGRVVQAAGACATSVLSRAIARDLFVGAALARTLTLITIAMAAAPGFSPLLGGVLDHAFGWRACFAFVAIFAAVSAIGFAAILGETHHAARNPFHVGSILSAYLALLRDRRFIVPASTVALIVGGLFGLFASAPRVMVEVMGYKALDVGFYFAGTVFVVFASGLIGNRLRNAIGLERTIIIALGFALVGGITVLAGSLNHASFAAFVVATLFFLVGLGIVNPLGTAQTMAPFAANAGAASALLGFMQMAIAGIAVALSAIVSRDPVIAIGIVLTAAALLAGVIYASRSRST
jgi:DHA1 family bicyclomycin/chloramphenicol resistance-like MFS transporter